MIRADAPPLGRPTGVVAEFAAAWHDAAAVRAHVEAHASRLAWIDAGAVNDARGVTAHVWALPVRAKRPAEHVAWMQAQAPPR